MTLQRPEPDSSLSRLLDAVVDWVRVQPDACGLALVGSHARDTARPESDIDLVILTPRASDYVAATDWAMRFGVVDRIDVEPYGALTSVRVHYAGGPEVEYGFAAPSWADAPLDAGTREVLRDGVRILWDRDGVLAEAVAASRPA